MNRPIKFRAWWKKEKKMLHNVQNFYDTLGRKANGNEEEPEQSFYGILTNPQFYVVMQFTGLLDRNGEEVYEGDILHRDNPKHFSMRRYVVVWDDDICGVVFEISGTSGQWINAYESDRYEVIGNIHANPELIGE
jgi:uncharacterized phage protein (TIGR01671 family)